MALNINSQVNGLTNDNDVNQNCDVNEKQGEDHSITSYDWLGKDSIAKTKEHGYK